MKYLLPLVLLAFGCTEEVIVEKIVEKPVYLTQTVTKTDTLFTTKEVVKDSVVYVPVYEVGDTVDIHHYDTVYVPVFVEVIDTVYVEREANVTYHPRYEPYVTYFFSKKPTSDMVIMDIHIDDIPIDEANGAAARYNTNLNTVKNGVLVIYITTGCPEAAIYRELLHHLYAWPYLNEWYEWEPTANDYIMAKNWGRCLENMSEEERTKYLSTYGLQ